MDVDVDVEPLSSVERWRGNMVAGNVRKLRKPEQGGNEIACLLLSLD